MLRKKYLFFVKSLLGIIKKSILAQKFNIMKIKTLLFIAFCFVNATYAQDNKLENCKKTCEKTEIVKEGVLLGVRINTAGPHRVHIMEVLPNTAALRQGLLVDDVITKLDGVAVGNHNLFKAQILTHKPEDVVTLTFERKGKEITQRVVLGWLTSKVVTSKVCCDDLEQIALENSLQVYPVPAKDKLTIDSPVLKGNYTVEVYNLLGELINSYTDNADVNGTVKVLDVSRLPANSYFVRVSNNGKSVTKNFLKEQ